MTRLAPTTLRWLAPFALASFAIASSAAAQATTGADPEDTSTATPPGETPSAQEASPSPPGTDLDPPSERSAPPDPPATPALYRGTEPETPPSAAPPEASPPAATESLPLSATAEVSIGVTPAYGVGLSGLAGIGGLAGGLGLGGRTDFVFAADPRVFLGFGLSVTHYELSDSGSGSGTGYDRVEVPLIFQLYFDAPRRGVAVPTLRVVPALIWSSDTNATSSGHHESVGGRLDVGVGVTWFATDWFAVRILGDIGVAAVVAYVGPDAVSVQANVGGDIGVVIRL